MLRPLTSLTGKKNPYLADFWFIIVTGKAFKVTNKQTKKETLADFRRD